MPGRMIERQAHAAGITEYLKNGCKLEIAQSDGESRERPNDDLYDQVSLDEVERIMI